MSRKWQIISAIFSGIFGMAMLAVPAYAANQRRPQPPLIRPPATAFHSAPPPVFHPTAPPRVAYRQPSPAPAPRLAFNRPPVRSFPPPRPAFNQRIPARPFPPMRTASVAGLHRVNPPAQPPVGHSARPIIARNPRDPHHHNWGQPQPHHGLICDQDGDHCRPNPQVICDGDRDNCRPVTPAPVVCDGDGDNCRQAPPQQLVCDGDGDNCRQVPYNYYPEYADDYPQSYYQPYYNYQQAYAPYYHPEPDADDFNAFYLPYQAPPVVCDADGDDCGPAPYFNAPYQAWAPLPPIPVPLNPVYYVDPELLRLRSRLIWMDQTARARYQAAVANRQARQAAHLFHETRSLDGQLARLDAQAGRGSAMRARYTNGSIR